MSARCWCFTLNNYTDEEEWALMDVPDARYIVWGHEVGENGTPHLQGYVEMDKVCRLAHMRLINGRAHWEQRRGTREAARAYCVKDGTEIAEIGDWAAGGQGCRTDLIGLKDAVRAGKSWIDIADDMPGTVAKYQRFEEKYRAAVEKEETRGGREISVHVLWGDTGAGKTKTVHDLEPKVFTVNSDEGFPFDGYDGEEAILIDDFYGGLKYGYLLRVLDRHQLRVNVKGSHRYAKWTRVYITSNKAPLEWYAFGCPPALERRLTSVTRFGNEVAGNTEPPLTGDGLIADEALTAILENL